MSLCLYTSFYCGVIPQIIVVVMSAANGQHPSVVVTASSDRTDMVCGLRGGEPMVVLEWHTKVLTSISLGAFDDTLLAVQGSWDNTVPTWDLTTGKQMDVLQRHSHSVESDNF